MRRQLVKNRQIEREARRRTEEQLSSNVEPLIEAPEFVPAESATQSSEPSVESSSFNCNNLLQFIAGEEENESENQLNGGYLDAKEFFKDWAIFYNMRRDPLEDVLRFLRSTGFFPNLPLTQKTLLGTPAEKVETIPVKPGEYVHFGIQAFAKELCQKIPVIRKLLIFFIFILTLSLEMFMKND